VPARRRLAPIVAWLALGAAVLVATFDPSFRATRVLVRGEAGVPADAGPRVTFAVEGARRPVPPGLVTADGAGRFSIEPASGFGHGPPVVRARGGARVLDRARLEFEAPGGGEAGGGPWSVEVRNYRAGGGWPPVWVVPGGVLGARVVAHPLAVALVFLGLPLALVAARAAWRRGGAPAAFLLALAVYLSNAERIGEVDAKPAPYVAISLLRDGDVDLDEFEGLRERASSVVVPGRDGRLRSKVPPGNVLVALPFFALPVWIGGLEAGSPAVDGLAKLVAALATAAAAALVQAAASARAPGRPARLAFVAFAFGTGAFSTAAQDLWPHGPALLGVALAAHALVARAPTPGSAALAGAGAGLALLARPIDGLLGLVALAVCARRGPRALVAFAAGAAPFALLLAGWNQACFGAPWRTGYGAEAAAFTGPWLEGLAGLLVAPSRGLLVYSPALALAVPGFLALRRRRAPAPAPAAGDPGGAALLILALYPVLLWLASAKWHAWVGGWSYGPRLILDAMPVLALLVAEAGPRLEGSARRRAFAYALVGWSVAVQALHAYAPSNDWHARHEHDLGRAAWSVADTQIGDHAGRLLGASRGGPR